MEHNGPQDQDGPDGSSLGSVSSLRSRFENMQAQNPSPKPNETPTPPTPVTSAAPAPPPPRTVSRSPSPKPPPVPDTRPSRSSVANGRAKPRESLDTPRPQIPAHPSSPSFINGSTGSIRSSRIMNPPPLSPKPTRPPAVMVEPPQSPARQNNIMTPMGDLDNRLNPELSKSPTTPAVPSNRPFKIPSRTTSPGLEPRRSPKPSASQPPSPPPPRRSAELRRERDIRPPPPVNRADKPGLRLANPMENAPKLEPSPQAADRRSPFSSPSGSDNEEPPVLPTRPQRPPQQQKAMVTRVPTAPAVINFEPPPLHHSHPSLAGRRRDQEINGQPRTSLPTQPTADRPSLPSRPSTTAEADPTRPPPANPTLKPPPRPPRSGVVTSSVTVDTTTASSQSGKRAVSNPTTQFAPPPSRTHNRSMTVDRTSEKTPAEFREPPRRVGIEEKGDQQSIIPTPVTPAAPTQVTTTYPDASKVNRRSPFSKQGNHELHTKYDTRAFDVCGRYVCTGGHFTRVWNILDGEQMMSLAHGEGIKAASVKFKPALDVRDESTRLWIGSNIGELMEADVATQSIVASKPNAHGRFEVVRIFRYFNEMWTLDESGTLHVWGPDSEGFPNLNNNPHQTFRLPRGHTFSMLVGEKLWHATGKEIRIFHPTVDGRTQVQVLVRPLVSEGAGEVTSGALLKTQPGKVFLGHADGKVSIYSQDDFTCLSVLTISNFKINSLAGVGRHIWAGYNSGKICVYDVNASPWVIKKDFQAHKDPVIRIVADESSFYHIDRLQVISLGADNVLRSWDGLLQDDFTETEMKAVEARYCTFEDINALVMTWNAGASTPSSLRYSEADATFIQNLLQSSGAPDILVFGFQELVDLEDKTATAKRLFKSKKKDPVTEQERMSHQYRDWRDFLVRSLDDYMPTDTLYHLLHSATLVGLFTCIFVKSSIHGRIRSLSSSEVKRGMGGLHGNKGAIIVRFMVDDTSLCFINCHLAAGQSQANARHNDIREILETAVFQPELDPAVRMDSYTGGGDGTMILDHELCLLNGDLNYRIDTMSRDTVVNAVKAGNLAKLLERDQLLVAKRRNPAFKLRAFEEAPITFAPTYKYDVGTDNYDTSEKKRSPAWCDRLLHRGGGRIQQLDYRRHEVRVSDHRPVTGRFKFTIKSVSPRERILAWSECQQRFEAFKEKEGQEEKLHYLMNVIGYDQATSQQLIREKDARKAKPEQAKVAGLRKVSVASPEHEREKSAGDNAVRA
ncbi:hypothetical protein DL768_000794 [Monosporascus sp. mg162]|nr:hypothetical protein DL768_000794 [Monosporascus sp. mg162]